MNMSYKKKLILDYFISDSEIKERTCLPVDICIKDMNGDDKYIKKYICLKVTLSE